MVIGNSAYTGAPALVNPANDDKAMGDALRRLGFTVVEVRDADKAKMSQAIAQVRDSLKGEQGSSLSVSNVNALPSHERCSPIRVS